MPDKEVITKDDVGVLTVAVDPHACHALHGAQVLIDKDIFCANCQQVTEHKLSVESLTHVHKINSSARAGLRRANEMKREELAKEGVEHVDHVHEDREPEIIATCACGRMLKFPLCDVNKLQDHLDAHEAANKGQVSVAQLDAAEAAHHENFKKLMGVKG